MASVLRQVRLFARDVQSIQEWLEKGEDLLPPSRVPQPLGSQPTQPYLPLLLWVQDGPSQGLKAAQTLTQQLPRDFRSLVPSLCLSPRDPPTPTPTKQESLPF